MTSLEKLLRANRWRVRQGARASQDTDGWNGDFFVPLDGQMYKVIISDSRGWKHLSITNAQKRVIPGWETMCRAKELFYGDDEWAVQFHPPKDDHINDHPHCLHLWMSIDEPMPHPLVTMV